jgi:uncharacterized membrane protein
VAIYFRNMTSDRIFVAFGWRDSGCEVQFRKSGWWYLPREWQACVYDGEARGTFYYYVMSYHRDVEWGGDGYFEVSDEAFDACFTDRLPDGYEIGWGGRRLDSRHLRFNVRD